MAGWGKLVAGAVLGVAGTLYATNEELRKQLPDAAQDLPENIRRRFGSAVAAAREASAERRAEILHELEEHGGEHDEKTGGADLPADLGDATRELREEEIERGVAEDGSG